MTALLENFGLNHVGLSERLEFLNKLVGNCENEKETRLDSLAGSIHSPCLIKVDAEGAEERILEGAKELNRLQGIRWLIETHSRELETACERILAGAGFQTRIIRMPGGGFSSPRCGRAGTIGGWQPGKQSPEWLF